MSFNPLEEKGIPLDRQLRNWSELNTIPYNKEGLDPYTRCRVITLNGIETESIFFSHNFARHCPDIDILRQLAQVRRVEQQQQKAVNWLIPGNESTLEVTIGYEQVAVDLTAWLARNEPNPYLRDSFNFGLLEDFDHLYRYANLLDLLEGKKAQRITGPVTEILPGRPTAAEHRHPIDDVRTPSRARDADPRSLLHALTLVASEQQTMNYYMNVGNRPMEPIARALYLEIAQIEEQHVTHYESLLDPTLSWLEMLVMHEYNECYMYHSFFSTESDVRIAALWELHLNMELEHLRIACDLLRRVENKDPYDILPKTMPAAVTFEENVSYIRGVIEDSVNWTADGTDYLPIADLPQDHRYFAYQTASHGPDLPPSEKVIELQRKRLGRDVRQNLHGGAPRAEREDIAEAG